MRASFLRPIHPLSRLGKAAKLELGPGLLRLLRAAALLLLVIDHSPLVALWVYRRAGLDMGHGMWIRVLGVVGYVEG